MRRTDFATSFKLSQNMTSDTCIFIILKICHTTYDISGSLTTEKKSKFLCHFISSQSDSDLSISME